MTPPVPIQGRLLTTISIGMAMVSNGTISVAMMTASTRSRPRHFRKTKEKAASEQTKSDSTTVTPVTSTELKMKSRDRRALEGGEIVGERDVADRQEGRRLDVSVRSCASGFSEDITMKTSGKMKITAPRIRSA